jgi:hypothetical protein
MAFSSLQIVCGAHCPQMKSYHPNMPNLAGDNVAAVLPFETFHTIFQPLEIVMVQAYATLIETGSNQAYIFGTNKMRECVGASELVRRVGTLWVVDALVQIFADCKDLAALGKADTTPKFTAAFRELAGPAEKQNNNLKTRGFEIVLATSGKAMVFFTDQAKAKDLVWRVTSCALTEAPGLTVRGVVSEMIDLGAATKQNAADFNTRLHHSLENMRNVLPPANFREPFWPILEPCQTSGLPKSTYVINRNYENPTETPSLEKHTAISVSSSIKDKMRDCAFERLRNDSKNFGHINYENFSDKVDASAIPWVAFVHADGNGFGNFFLNLHHKISGTLARDYFDCLRRFSLSLELCSQQAFYDASTETFGRTNECADLVPLVLGGDDLTVAIDGTKAVKFIAAYLKAFEKVTEEGNKLYGQPNEIKDLAKGDKFGAAAGVAIVKPHFPFHRAYELSESLLKSAKQAKTKARDAKKLPVTFLSSFDFQVVYNDGAVKLKSAREEWDKEDFLLTARPFVVTTKERYGVLDDTGKAWAKRRLYDPIENAEAFSLTEAREALAAKRKEGDLKVKALPRSQQKGLRDALFVGKAVAEARFSVLKERYQADTSAGETGFCWSGNLFQDADSNEPKATTLFLDAMDLVDIGEGETK